MVTSGRKAKSIHPLDGGYDGYIETLERVRSYVDSKSALTKEGLKSWYSKTYGPGNAVAGINSLFRSGLLAEENGRIKCSFPKGLRKNRQVIEIINAHVVYILDMLYEAREGATDEQLHARGKKYGLTGGSNHQIWWRRGWLQSAKLLKPGDDHRLYPTDLGRRLLDERFPTPVDPANDAEVNPKESGGEGEGRNHKTLKEYVYKVADKVCGAKSVNRKMEYALPSGDKVDVTAWNARTIWHIEVKSCTSKDPDIERGLYQTVKYDAVGKATVKAENTGQSVESLLVVETELSPKVRRLADKLDVRVYRLPASMRGELKKLRAAFAL